MSYQWWKTDPHLKALKTYYSSQLVILSSRILQEHEIFGLSYDSFEVIYAETFVYLHICLYTFV